MHAEYTVGNVDKIVSETRHNHNLDLCL